jgi:hypothetical protein
LSKHFTAEIAEYAEKDIMEKIPVTLSARSGVVGGKNAILPVRQILDPVARTPQAPERSVRARYSIISGLHESSA